MKIALSASIGAAFLMGVAFAPAAQACGNTPGAHTHNMTEGQVQSYPSSQKMVLKGVKAGAEKAQLPTASGSGS